MQWAENVTFTTHLESLDYLKKKGFKVIPHDSCDTIEQAVEKIQAVGDHREDYPFDIDARW